MQEFGSYHRKTTLCLHYKDWSVSAIYRNSQYLTPESIKHANAVYQKNRELWMIKQVVHIVTTGLSKVQVTTKC